MRFTVYQTENGATIVVPLLFKPPAALAKQGQLKTIGEIDVDLLHFTHGFVNDLGLNGYGTPWGADEVVIASAVTMLDKKRLPD